MKSNNQHQHGIALLTLIILVALAAITFYFSTISPVQLKVDRQQNTHEVLKEAKQALIAYAIIHVDMPSGSPPYNNLGEYGGLPCPDINPLVNSEGQSDGSCDTNRSVSLGYLPWKTIDIDALKDSAGGCLFYAVSPEYKSGPVSSADMLNEDTNGMIQIVDSTGAVVKGATASTRPVAVILAAGAALAGQNRSPNGTTICGLDYNNITNKVNIPAYLDNDGTTDNGAGPTADDEFRKFVAASYGSESKTNPLNDQLITISREDIWGSILKRSDFKTKINNLTEALAMCLADYANDATKNPNRRLPWPAPINLSGADYKDNNSYKDAAGSLYAGRLPYDISNSSAKISSTVTTLFATTGCDNLVVNGGTVVDLQSSTSEYFKLWQNWKDHFFYAMSKVYEPVSGSPGESQCNAVTNDCITVKDSTGVVTPYAGIVFYAGSRLSGQSRDAPPPTGDADNKAVISNYLENGNDLIFSDPSVPYVATGTETDTYSTNGTDPSTENDVMWCIKNEAPATPLDVVSC